MLYLSVALNIIPLDHFSIKPMNFGVILGSAILALGFGMIGAFLFTLAYPVLNSIGLFKNVIGGKTTLLFLSEKYNFLFHGTSWIGVFIGIVLIAISLAIPYSLSRDEKK